LYTIKEKESAMLELTKEQRLALETTNQTPPVIMDPETNTAYVLVRRELYEQLYGLLDEDDARLMAPLLADIDPEDWEDAAAYEEKP
jgi:hypothetical protein